MRQFDLANPLPSTALLWQAERRRLQAIGVLPPGVDQTDASYKQLYLDDLGIAGGTDIVAVPSYLRDIRISAKAWAAAREGVALDPTSGGRHLRRETRIHVYCLIAVWNLILLKLSCSFDKTVAATRAIILGLRIRPGDGIIDCPELKAKVMLQGLRDLRDRVQQHRAVLLEPLECLVGRLGNISQIYCAIRLWIAAAYALIRLRYRCRSGSSSTPDRRRYVRRVVLRPGGRREREIVRLCDAAERELERNEGVPLAPRAVFPSPEAAGVALVVTDASGKDGVGGYATHSSSPRVVWLLSEWWPVEVQIALDRAADSLKESGQTQRFAMPAAELFGMTAITAALHEQIPVSAVIAVGDCLPAARAVNASSSSSAQMRHLIQGASQVVQQWLAVQVHREFNTDPDRLSHPDELDKVWQEVLDAGWTPKLLRPTPDSWRQLFEAIRLPLAVDELLPQFA
jgi:hypothetical protein